MKKAELIFIPSPGMGHLMAAVEMAKLLISQHHRLFITVIAMKLPFDSKAGAYAESLSDSSTVSDRISFIILPHRKNNYADPNPLTFNTSFMEDQKPHVKHAVAELIHSKSTAPDSPRLAGFLIDMFCTAMIDVADEFGLPSYVFYTSGAGFLGFMFHLLSLHDDYDVDTTDFAKDRASTELFIPSFVNPVPASVFPGVVSLHDDYDVDTTDFAKDRASTELFIPSFVNPVPASVFPGVVLDKTSASSMMMHTRNIRKNTKGILVNTFTELESHAVRSLSDAKFPPIYPVGPVLNLNRDESDRNSDIIKWLDDQPSSSVLFLCFGSMGSFNEAQIQEIAIALEQSGVRFLWSLRRPPSKEKMVFLSGDYADPEEVLPKGFLDRTAGIGKIIGWAPQVNILAHQAVGGFVSHCGWNSILESIWFGVPIATWPLHAEQQLNAFQMVKDLGVAVEIKLDTRNSFYVAKDHHPVVNAEEIKVGIEKVMEVDCEVRKRVKEMSEKSRKVSVEGGSSHSSLQTLINVVMDSLA